eukprot:g37476.t1
MTVQEKSGNVCVELEDRAAILKHYFAEEKDDIGIEVREQDTNNMPVIDNKETKVGEDLETIIIMKEEVLGKLMELQVDKSPGTDGMHPRALKEM